MKLALILPAVIGMLDSEMSASGQYPDFLTDVLCKFRPHPLRLVGLPPPPSNQPPTSRSLTGSIGRARGTIATG
jgi:hypothetical protein